MNPTTIPRMCGLGGILVFAETLAVDEGILGRMSACIAHRGPDGEGQLLQTPQQISPSTPQLGLVHRRLAILDPDPRANQPYADEGGRVIVFNGEIYNFRELRSQWPERPWRTTGDTEVLLAALEGATAPAGLAAALERLNGMYAFAVWDPQAQTLVAARDRMGQKPFYYAFSPGEYLAFASEPSALLALPFISREVSDEGLADYLAYGFNPRGTIYRQIHRLPPGHWLTCRNGQVQTGRYFSPNAPAIARLDELEAVERVRELLLAAVRRQLVSDVPLGCFLSGGVDSSIVAAAMRQVLGADGELLSFTIGFEDARYDESAYAAEVARHLKTRHHAFVVRPNAAEDLPRLAAAFAEPFGDSSALPTHYLSRETRSQVKVALSGDGGDELFAGYDRYRAMGLGARLRPLAPALAPLSRMLPGTHPKSRLARAKRLAASLHLPPEERYAAYLHLANLRERQLASDPVAERFALLHAGGRDLAESAMATDREIYLPEDLLFKLDRCSMLHALEVRSPFMDHELVHFAASLPSGLLLGKGVKRLLRLAFAPDLPPMVFARRKMGFAVPIGEWFRTGLREMLHDLLLRDRALVAERLPRAIVQRVLEDHQSRRADHTQFLYALLMLELWHGSVGS